MRLKNALFWLIASYIAYYIYDYKTAYYLNGKCDHTYFKSLLKGHY
jgi:hypothetical protein